MGALKEEFQFDQLHDAEMQERAWRIGGLPKGEAGETLHGVPVFGEGGDLEFDYHAVSLQAQVGWGAE